MVYIYMRKRLITKIIVYITIIVHMIFFGSISYANPQNPNVVSGQATVSTESSTVNINQSTDKAIINWENFNINSGETTRFKVPSSSAITLNRVIGNNLSTIYGNLFSNGRLFLINTSGIYFGPNSVVDVAGLIASTLNISNENFNAGRYIFSKDDNYASSIINDGTIRITDDGFVGLIAPIIENNGTINARLGDVVLASGKLVTVDLMGDGLINFAVTPNDTLFNSNGEKVSGSISNSGVIQAYGGNITLTAESLDGVLDSMINVTGLVDASNIKQLGDGELLLFAGGDGGNINIRSNNIKIDSRAAVKASGQNKGGEINLVASNFIEQKGLIQADGVEDDGGTINFDSTYASIGGTTSASGKSGGLISIDVYLVNINKTIEAIGLEQSGGEVIVNASREIEQVKNSIINVTGNVDGGSIYFNADEFLVTSGTYYAKGLTGKGGNIDVTAKNIQALFANFDSSGYSAGGRVRIGGDYLGGKKVTDDYISPELLYLYRTRWEATDRYLENSEYLFVNNSTTINANVLGPDGVGGTVILWSDLRTISIGNITTLPGELSGSGGVVEISSGDLLTMDSYVKTGIDERTGTLLLDPRNVFIASFNTDSATLIASRVTLNLDYADSISLDDTDIEHPTDPGSNPTFYARLAVGDLDGGGGPGLGRVRIYSFQDEDFASAALLTSICRSGCVNNIGSITSSDEFGSSVSLSTASDGSVANLVIGSPGRDVDRGAVYLISFADTYTLDAAYYNLDATISYQTPSGKDIIVNNLSPGDKFGTSVSYNQRRLAVGAIGDDGALNYTTEAGAVYLFDFSDDLYSNSGSESAIIGLGYTETALRKDINVDISANEHFGTSLSLYNKTLAVGSPDMSSYSGVVKIFNFPERTFSSQQGSEVYEISGPLTYDLFGKSVSVYQNKLLVGAPGDDGSGNALSNSGELYFYEFSDETLTSITNLTTIGYGYDVNLSGIMDSLDALGTSVALGSEKIVSSVHAGSPRIWLFSGSRDSETTASSFSSLPLPPDDVTLSGSRIEQLLEEGNTLEIFATNNIYSLARIEADSMLSGNAILKYYAGNSIFIADDIIINNGEFYAYANTGYGSTTDDERAPGNAVFDMSSGTTIGVGSGNIVIYMLDGDTNHEKNQGYINLRNLEAPGGSIELSYDTTGIGPTDPVNDIAAIIINDDLSSEGATYSFFGPVTIKANIGEASRIGFNYYNIEPSPLVLEKLDTVNIELSSTLATSDIYFGTPIQGTDGFSNYLNVNAQNESVIFEGQIGTASLSLPSLNIADGIEVVMYDDTPDVYVDNFSSSSLDNIIIHSGGTDNVEFHGNATFDGDLNSYVNLKISGNAAFTGNSYIYSDSLEVTGTTSVNSLQIYTAGEQKYTGDVTFTNSSAQEIESSSGPITFESGLLGTTDGVQDVSIISYNPGAVLTFNDVGSVSVLLKNFEINTNNDPVILKNNVYAVNQKYNDGITLDSAGTISLIGDYILFGPSTASLQPITGTGNLYIESNESNNSNPGFYLHLPQIDITGSLDARALYGALWLWDDITTTQTQEYSAGTVLLDSPIRFRSSLNFDASGNDIIFNNSVGSSSVHTVLSDSNLYFNDDIHAYTSGTSILLDIGNGNLFLNTVGSDVATNDFTVIGGGSGVITLQDNINTTGIQTYSNPVELGASVNLTGSLVDFNYQVNSTNSNNYALTVTGDAEFSDEVGTTDALSSLTVTGDADIYKDITTTGNQTYQGGTNGVDLFADILLSANTVDFQAAISGAHNLTISNGGLFKGNVDIANLIVNSGAGGTTTIGDGIEIATSGTQTYNSSVILDNTINNTDNFYLDSSGNLITFNSAVSISDAGSSVTLTATDDQLIFNSAINAGDAADALTIDIGSGLVELRQIGASGPTFYGIKTQGTGTTTLYNDITTENTLIFDNPVLLTNDTQLISKYLEFNNILNSTSGNNYSLTTQNTLGGYTKFNGILGGTDKLSLINATSLGNTICIYSDIYTVGTQTYTGPVVLANSSLTLDSLNNSTITFNDAVTMDTGVDVSLSTADSPLVFNSTIDADTADQEGLTLNLGSGGTGTLNIAGEVGGLARLKHFVITGSEIATLNSDVNTLLGQTYNNPIEIAGNIELTGSLIDFNNILNSAASNFYNLTVTGNAEFSDEVGGTKGLNNLVVSGETNIYADILTDAIQNFQDSVVLYNDVNLTASLVSFGDSLDGNYNLILNTNDQSLPSVLKRVGGITPLKSLTVNGTGANAQLILHDHVTTEGSQSYDIKLQLASNTAENKNILTTTDNGTIDFKDIITRYSPSATVGLEAIADGTGDVIFRKQIASSGNELDLLTATAGVISGVIDLYADIYTSGIQTFNSPVILNTDDLTLTSGGVVFNSSLNSILGSNYDFTILASSGNNVTLNLIGNTEELNNLSVTTAGAGAILINDDIDTLGSQTYTGLAILNDATLNLNANGSAISFDTVKLGDTVDVTLDTNNAQVTFGSTTASIDAWTNGVEGLTLDIGTGSLLINGPIGSNQALKYFEILGTGTTTFGSAIGSITTTGTHTPSTHGTDSNSQTYDTPILFDTTSITLDSGGNPIKFYGAVSLGDTKDLTISALDDGLVFNSTIDAFTHQIEALTINVDDGTLGINGIVGGTRALRMFTVQGTSLGSTLISNDITTLLTQTYQTPVLLGGDTLMTGSTVTFGDSLDSASTGYYSLTVDGNASFNDVGANRALNNLEVTGSVTLSGSVITIGTQTYGSDLVINTNLSLRANGLNFGGKIDGTGRLTLCAGNNDLTFDHEIGSIIPLGALIIDCARNVCFEKSVDVGEMVLGNASSTVGISGTVDFQSTTNIITGLTTFDEPYNIKFGGTTTVAGLTNFDNTGYLTLGDNANDEIRFTGGLVASGVGTNPRYVNIFGKLLTSNKTIDFKTLNVLGDSLIDTEGGNSSTAQILIEVINSGGHTITLDGGNVDVGLGIDRYSIEIDDFSQAGNLIFRDSYSVKTTGVINADKITLQQIVREVSFLGDLHVETGMYTDGPNSNPANNNYYNVKFLGDSVYVGGLATFYSPFNQSKYNPLGEVTLNAVGIITFEDGIIVFGNLYLGGSFRTLNSTVFVHGDTVLVRDGSYTSVSGSGDVTFLGKIEGVGKSLTMLGNNVSVGNTVELQSFTASLAGEAVFNNDIITTGASDVSAEAIKGSGDFYSQSTIRLASNNIETDFISAEGNVTFGGFIKNMKGRVAGQNTFLKDDFIAQGKIKIETGANIENFSPIGEPEVAENALSDNIAGATGELNSEQGESILGEESGDLFQIAMGDEDEDKDEEEEDQKEFFEYTDQEKKKPEPEKNDKGEVVNIDKKKAEEQTEESKDTQAITDQEKSDEKKNDEKKSEEGKSGIDKQSEEEDKDKKNDGCESGKRDSSGKCIEEDNKKDNGENVNKDEQAKRELPALKAIEKIMKIISESFKVSLNVSEDNK